MTHHTESGKAVGLANNVTGGCKFPFYASNISETTLRTFQGSFSSQANRYLNRLDIYVM